MADQLIDGSLQGAGDLHRARQRQPIHASFVFLHLLEGEAQPLGQCVLTDALIDSDGAHPKADLGVDSGELKETEEAYEANLRQAKLAQREFEDKVRKVEKQLSQVKIKEAQAEAAAALSSTAFKIGDLGDTMKTVDEILQKRYEVSAGKARVARDMVDMDQITEKENERKALEQVALAEFLASQGIQATPAAEGETPAAAKEIGPQQ